jgi:hypothetical protein
MGPLSDCVFFVFDLNVINRISIESFKLDQAGK